MPAIITSPFRVQNAKRLVSAVTTEKVYITVGKSDDWASSDTVIETPSSSVKNLTETTGNILAMKNVIDTGTSLAIPMVRYVQAAYKEYDVSSDTNFIAGTVGGVSCLPAYCVVQVGAAYNVYKCVSNSKNTTGVIQTTGITAPSTLSYTTPELLDGYLWAYMFTASSTSSTFSTSFIPTPSSVNTDVNIANNKGKIYGYKVISGGSGYTDGDYNIGATGNGSGATATIKIVGGIVVRAVVLVSGSPQYGTGYTRATLTVTGFAGVGSGTGAVVQPLLTPLYGHGYDPANELNAYYAVFSVAFGPGGENLDLPAVNDFRQVGLLLNPLDNSSVPITSLYAEASKTLVFSGGFTGTQPLDGILYQPSSGAKAFIDSVSGNNIRFHQNYSPLVNFKTFTTGSIVYIYSANTIPVDGIGSGKAGDGTLTSIIDSEYKPESGQLLFVENRQKITRADAQTEDIKIIIQF